MRYGRDAKGGGNEGRTPYVTGSTYVDTDVDSNLDQGGVADGKAEADADTYANAEGVSHGGTLSCCCCFLFSYRAQR